MYLKIAFPNGNNMFSLYYMVIVPHKIHTSEWWNPICIMEVLLGITWEQR